MEIVYRDHIPLSLAATSKLKRGLSTTFKKGLVLWNLGFGGSPNPKR